MSYASNSVTLANQFNLITVIPLLNRNDYKYLYHRIVMEIK